MLSQMVLGVGESVLIGEVRLTVISVNGEDIRLAVEAPPAVMVRDCCTREAAPSDLAGASERTKRARRLLD